MQLLSPIPHPASLRYLAVEFVDHRRIYGPGPVPVSFFTTMGGFYVEPGLAVVLRHGGRHLKAGEALRHITGVCLRLRIKGPQGRDMGTQFGPWVVTIDELRQHAQSLPHSGGVRWMVPLEFAVNGQVLSTLELRSEDIHFGDLLEEASLGTALYTGDVLAERCGKAALLQVEDRYMFSSPVLGTLHGSVCAVTPSSSITSNQWLYAPC